MKIAVICPYVVTPLQKIGISVREESRSTGTINLSLGLAKIAGLEVHQLSLNSQIEKDVTVIEKGVIIHYLMIPKYVSSFSLFQYPRHLIHKALDEISPDIVHGHHAELASTYYAISSRFPAVSGIHNYIPDIIKWQKIRMFSAFRILRYFEKYTFRNSHMITVDSPDMKEKIQPFVKGEIRVIPNCIGENFFALRNETEKIEEPTLVFIGSHRPEKGLITLLNAMKIVSASHPKVRLKIIGAIDPAFRKHYDETIVKGNMIDQVVFLGWQEWDSISKELTSAMLLIVPSLHEPFGCVVAEGMAMGLPVIGSRVGGIKTSIEHMRTGFLFDPGNTDDLASKIILMITDKQLRINVGNNAKAHALRTFHPDVVAMQHKLLYEEILNHEKVA